jgi:hypothetical protein
MRDKLEGDAASGQTRTITGRPVVEKRSSPKPRRKAETPTVTDDLTGKFLRVGNKLYRTSDDKKPIVRLESDRLITSNIDALPDIVRIAKANGWTSLKITGGDTFKKAAFLAAAAHGLDVDNYTPSKIVQAEADRLRARLAERAHRREAQTIAGKRPQPADDISQRKALSERFLSQSTAQNARDPALRNAQALVTQEISDARARYPDDQVKAAKDVEAKRHQLSARIANGDRIAAVQVRNQQKQHVRENSQDQSMKRDGPSR